MRKKNTNYRDNNGIREKQCSICSSWFPCTEEYFHKNKSNKTDGLYPYCKTCSSEKVKQRYRENPESFKEYDRMKHETNPEYFTLKHRRYSTKYRIREKERVKNFQKNNPDKMKTYYEKRKSKNHTISNAEWIACKSYFNFSCAYCGMTDSDHKKLYNQDLHKEHVDDDGSNDLSNCVPSCKVCNGSKWKFDLNKWYNYKNSNYSIERYAKIMNWITGDYLNFIENKNE